MKKIATLAGVCVTVLTLPALAQAHPRQANLPIEAKCPEGQHLVIREQGDICVSNLNMTPEYREVPCEPGWRQYLNGLKYCFQVQPHSTTWFSVPECFGYGFLTNFAFEGENTGKIQAKNLELSSPEPGRLTFTVTDNSEPTTLPSGHVQKFLFLYWSANGMATTTDAIPWNTVPLDKGMKVSETIAVAPGTYSASAEDLEEWPLGEKCTQQVSSMFATTYNGKAVTVR